MNTTPLKSKQHRYCKYCGIDVTDVTGCIKKGKTIFCSVECKHRYETNELCPGIDPEYAVQMIS